MDKVNNFFFLGWCTRNLYILWFTLFPLCDVEQLTLKSEIRMTKGWFQLSEWHSSLKWECPGLSEQHSGLQSEWPEGTIILALPVWTFGTTLAHKSEIRMTKDDFSFLDMCQDEWWLYHSIFQWLCSDGTGTGDLDTCPWGVGLGHGVTRLLSCCSPCTCLGSEEGRTHMLWDGCPGIVAPPPSHTHSHCCYTWP